jgi:hypothetical protein
VVGESFPKLYVCFHHKWNPYDPQYDALPPEYWISMSLMIRLEYQTAWDSLLKPLGEMVGQIANPDAFQVYWKYAQREKNRKKNVASGEDYYHEDMDGISGSAESNSYFDPERGLVDMKGNIIIPKEKYQEMLGLNGVAISY